MTEKNIYLRAIDPLVLYGPNNQLLDILQRSFPKVKIVARGDQIKLMGTVPDLERLESKIKQIFDHIEHFNRLSADQLEEILYKQSEETVPLNKGKDDVLLFGQKGRAIKARNPHQKELLSKYNKHDLLIATGPAGSGKTYFSVALAVRALKNREVKRIILSRPAVESGEQLGFLPGDLKEKLDPYLQPLYDALLDMMPAKKLNELMEENVIQIAPLAFMRGRTLENCFVILDEAQNATVNQVKMFLTRMGEHAKFIITGDVTQVDLPKQTKSGLIHARKLLSNIKGIAMIDFDKNDIIRHKLVQKIVNAYESEQTND
ncbi:MAG: PhoH family protein [Bacteroidales bacterium]|nr:PhoH family protein [Bacteroidales bacterium]